MSEPIKVGDLVVVVRGHKCDVGAVYRVSSIQKNVHGWVCGVCGFRKLFHSAWADRGDCYGAPLPWLKRIPPLEELEGEKRDEQIKEPA